ncbi:MAG: DNA mismatch repair endonuclease MutL [Simkania negevensis]|nr:DNA mismatch repair endonuclease MutL [Simkania negevensis]
MTIHILDEETINKIAAGEVIENPASVVKELVENAVDAGASRVVVEIAGGGFQRIGVQDDGKGMGKRDLLLCLERHATSKIAKAEDLEKISSMGFRGEALAAIGAISKMVISSSLQGEEVGHRLLAEGGRIKGEGKSVRKGGTSVEVSQLFYNVPARRKFQKSPEASQAEILKMVLKLALAHPSVRFELLSDEKGSLLLSRGGKEGEEGIKQAASDLLGTSFLEGAIRIQEEREGKKLLGWVGSPLNARYNRSGQYLFINGRSVFSQEISSAIYDGYGTRLQSNRHPLYLLYLTVPGQGIDVNVHPQKREVRFLEGKEICIFVRKAIHQGLGEKAIFSLNSEVPSFPFVAREKGESYWDSCFLEEQKQFPLPFSMQQEEFELPFAPFALFAHLLFVDAKGWEKKLSLQEEGGILLVNLQGASAQILYNRLVAKRGALQSLLLPIPLEVSIAEKELLLLYLERMKEMGISLRLFGPTTFLIEAMDPLLDESSLPALVFELLEIFHTFERQGEGEKEKEKKIASLLSSFVRKGKKRYTLEEGRKLCEELFKSSSPLRCPKGRKIIRHFGWDEIEKLFY